jgi:serine protease Do
MHASAFLRQSTAPLLGVLVLGWSMLVGAQTPSDTIQRLKGSVVAVGTFQKTRSPPFQFSGTGFVVADGTYIVTNAHVLPAMLDPSKMEVSAILLPGKERDQVQVREARQVAVDSTYDIALLKIDGTPLPAVKLRNSDSVREGQDVLFTGFPIGAVLGPFPATHRGIVSAITPIAIPQGRAADLDAKMLRRLAAGSFPVFQLDATAYPGNSGSPLYDPVTGDVLGVINMVLVKGTRESILSQPSGITYAVPSKYIQDLVDKGR